MLLLILALIYAVWLFKAAYIWNKAPVVPGSTRQLANNTALPTYGVIVVFRNEALKLPALLEALKQQSDTHFSLHLADDNSTDNSVSIIEEFKKSAPFEIELHKVKNRQASAKKSAISQIVRANEVAHWLVTDADCQPAPNWVALHKQLHGLNGFYFISGPLIYTAKSNYFSKIQQLEFLALVGLGGVGILTNYPGMCNAANMSFSKSAFSAVNGYEGYDNIASGDDEFLLKKIADFSPGSIAFIKSEKALVLTEPAENWSAFYNQRKRWAGKWRNHDWQGKMKAVGVAVFYALWLLGTFVAPVPLVVLCWSIKALADYIFLRSIAQTYRQSISFVAFIGLLLVYPIYVLFFAVAANFGTFSWKGRQYSQGQAA